MGGGGQVITKLIIFQLNISVMKSKIHFEPGKIKDLPFYDTLKKFAHPLFFSSKKSHLEIFFLFSTELLICKLSFYTLLVE